MMTAMVAGANNGMQDIGPAPASAARGWLWRVALAWLALAWLALAGCATTLISDHDPKAVERTLAVARQLLATYQTLLDSPADARRALVNGHLKPRYAEAETQLRLHLLQEQARDRNDEGATIAANLLRSWQEFAASHRTGDATALADATLNIQRGILERHLRAALAAEEAKKPGSSKRAEASK